MTEHTLVEQALHIPRSEARRWRHTPLDQEDLVADGYVGLVKAARRFDPSYDVPFTAFARPYVRGAITDAVRSRARRESLGDGTFADVVGFPELAPQGDDGASQEYEPPDPGPSPHDTVESLERLRTLATLPECERIALVRTVVDGDAVAEVAKDLGISSHRVYTLVSTGAARVRKRAA